jgi:hypothetical protein
MIAHVALSFLGKLPLTTPVPQLRLRQEFPAQSWLANALVIPFVSFQEEVKEEFATVEVRNYNGRLVALGCCNSAARTVECYHFFSNSSTNVPVVDAEFIQSKIARAMALRREVVSPTTTCYRAVHGTVDLLPGMYVDHYCSSFARVTAKNSFAEACIPALADFLQRHGTEEILLSTPSTGQQRVMIVPPLVKLPARTYKEDSVEYLWLPPDLEWENERGHLLLCPHFRRCRRAIRESCHSKNVLCFFDRSGGATLNAVINAKNVVAVDPRSDHLNWLRENLTFNHGEPIYEKVRALQCLDELPTSLKKQFGVASIEQDHEQCSSTPQWVDWISQAVNQLQPSSLLFLMFTQAGEGHVVDAVKAASEQCCRRLYRVHEWGAAVDFPVADGVKSGEDQPRGLAYIVE